MLAAVGLSQYLEWYCPFCCIIGNPGPVKQFVNQFDVHVHYARLLKAKGRKPTLLLVVLAVMLSESLYWCASSFTLLSQRFLLNVTYCCWL